MEGSEPQAVPIRILWVEDSPTDIDLGERELKKAGIEVESEVVETLDDLVAHLEAATYDVILSDHGLPGWTGMEALEQVRQAGKDIPFIVVTGALGDEAAVDYIRKGASNYVLKKNLQRLPLAVRQTLIEQSLRRARARAQEALRISEERFRLLAENARDTIYRYRIKPNPGLDYVSPSVVMLTGYTPEEYYANPGLAYRLVHPDDRGLLEQAPEESAGKSVTLRWRRKDGRFIWAEQRNGAVYDKSGTLVAIEGIIRDTTERKGLLDKAHRLAAIVEASEDAIIGLARDGTITTWNPGAEKMFGYKAAELERRSIALLAPSDLKQERFRLARKMIGGEQVVQHEMRGTRKDGEEVWLSLSASPIRGEDGRIESFSVTARDITAHRLVEQQLRQAQKMEAVGRLVGGVAHDFNNRLTVIIGVLQMLERTDEEGAQWVRTAARAAAGGAELISRLLAFSRQQVLEPKVIVFEEALEEICELLRRTIGENVELKTAWSDEAWKIRVDGAQFEAAILNLALNAKDAMPKGGRLTIETAEVHLNEDYARANAEMAPGSYVIVAVRDTGKGIAPEHLGQVFEPFFTTKETGEGTGLGLSMVHGFIKQSRGHVEICSEPGEGTEVKLYFPRSREPVDPKEKATGSTMPRGEETILVVEDDSDVRETVVKSLKDLGYAVLEANDGESAIEIVNGDRQIDLLFTDVVLSGQMDGFTLAREAQEVRSGLKVLYTSGYVRSDFFEEIESEGRSALLVKPYREEALAARVREALDV